MKGYSLIELMVVMTLFAILMLVATQTLLVSLRGSSKSESVGKVKENLEYAVSIMERQVRSAKAIIPCSADSSEVLNFVTTEGLSNKLSCVDIGNNGYVASGSANIRLTNTNIGITDCSLTCRQTAGIPSEVTIYLVAEDQSGLPGAERARAESTTRVLLRQY